MLSLSRHTSVCLCDGQLVLLDLLHDRYLSLPPAESKALIQVLQTGAEAGETSDGLDEVIGSLLERGLLTRVQETARQLELLSGSELAGDLMGYPIGQRPVIRTGEVICYLWAAANLALRLRWTPLHRVIARALRQRQRALARHPQAYDREQDMARLIRLVEVCKRLRPLLFGARNRCLYDSLVLAELLNRYGLAPRIVLGVKMGPFQAHCWLEQHGLVLNDALAHVAGFTPIMEV